MPTDGRTTRKPSRPVHRMSGSTAIQRQMPDCTKDQQTFNSSGKFHGKQRQCQLAAVICFAAMHFYFLYVEVVEVDLCHVIADADGVDNATGRTLDHLVKQQVRQQEMTYHVTKQIYNPSRNADNNNDNHCFMAIIQVNLR